MADAFAGKKVLVAGGAGFVGVNLINELLRRGAAVTATLHRKKAVVLDERVRYRCAELTRAEDCAAVVKGQEIVFMCAANTSGAAVMAKTPLAHVTPNVLMNTLILEAAHAARVGKFVWMSSNTVYPATDTPVREDEMMSGPVFEKYFCVAWMKRFTEILCEMYAAKIKDPMKTVVVRPANIYGPYDDFEWETSHVIPALVRKVVERHAPLEVWGDGNDIKDLIYIDDFIEGLLLAAEKMGTYDPVNIGTGRQATIREALGHMLKADGYKDANVVFDASKPTMIPKRLLDTTKAKRLLGFEARTSLAEGIAKTVAWYRKTYHP